METRPKILIVDDELGFIADSQATFTARGYQVIAAGDRRQAQQVALSERPDLVIVGTIMPRGDAFLLHQWLKQTPSCKDLPLIVVDAPAEKQLLRGWRRDEGLRLQSDDYLVKPVDTASMLPLIEKLLDKTTRRIKVLVVDDHAIIREGIRALLALHKDIQVVGEAVDGRDALEKARELMPDVVLMDIVMPVMNGLEAARQLGKECQQTKVLMLTQYDDEENILASAQVGAFGFIPKRSASSQLLDSIRTVNQGKRFIPLAS